MVGDDYGIRWLPTYVEADGAGGHGRSPTFPPINRMLRPPSIRSRSTMSLRYDTMYVETGRYLRQMIARRADRRRQDRGPASSPRRPTSRRLPESAGVQLHRPRHRASCSATRSCNRSAASSRSSSRSPRSAMRSPAGPATCSRGPTASSSAARSSATSGTRRREPAAIARIIAVAQALLRRLPLHRLNRLAALRHSRRNELSYLHSPERRGPAPKC